MISFFIGLSIGIFLCYYFKPITSLDKLKNALLIATLLKFNKDDFNNSLNMNYSSYDGTKLPHLSGYDETNAIYTYLCKHSGYHMNSKYNAIMKYLNYHFDNENKVYNFLNRVVKETF